MLSLCFWVWIQGAGQFSYKNALRVTIMRCGCRLFYELLLFVVFVVQKVGVSRCVLKSLCVVRCCFFVFHCIYNDIVQNMIIKSTVFWNCGCFSRCVLKSLCVVRCCFFVFHCIYIDFVQNMIIISTFFLCF